MFFEKNIFDLFIIVLFFDIYYIFENFFLVEAILSLFSAFLTICTLVYILTFFSF